MEDLIPFFTSKTFIAFVILIVVYNVVRRYSRGVQRRTSRAQRRMRDAIRERQLSTWEDEDRDASSRPD